MADIRRNSLSAMMVRRIKTLQGLSGIGEDNYRALLWSYGVESCKDLSILDGHAVIKCLQSMVNRIPEKRQFRQAKPYWELTGRSTDMASVKQLRMLEAMWMGVTRQTTRSKALEAYQAWLETRFRIKSVEWIARDQVGKIKFALEQMRAQAER